MILFLCLIVAHIQCRTVTVNVHEGTLEGNVNDTTSVAKFFGVPFAAAPVGDFRWKPAQPPLAWSNIRDASKFGAACLQLDVSPVFPSPSPQSEDCLFLNIWTRYPFNASRPVMMWLHGGGKSDDAGQGADGIYDGTHVAQTQDVVVVTVNYRLGPFGFLSLPGLRQEDPLGSTGNYALTDNIQALKWLRVNVNVFGGDPTRITMYGVSAGGSLTLTHLVNPMSSGLFHRAIIESGTGLRTGYGQLSINEGYSNAQLVSSTVGCGNISSDTSLPCLRKADAQAILSATQTNCIWLPTVDNVHVLGDPYELVKQGKFNKMPTIIGCTKDEGSGDALQSYGPFLSSLYYKDALKCWFSSSNVDLVYQQYSLSEFPSPYWALETALGDWDLKCSTRRLATFISQHSVPAYIYEWSYSVLGSSVWNYLGAFHGSDVPFVFQSESWLMSPAELEFSDKVIKLWTQFAATGNPNSPNVIVWPSYNAISDLNVNFNQNLTITVENSMGTGSRCDFWDKLNLGMQKPICSPDWYYCRN